MSKGVDALISADETVKCGGEGALGSGPDTSDGRVHNAKAVGVVADLEKTHCAVITDHSLRGNDETHLSVKYTI